MTYLEQTEEAGRHIFPDLARAFALIGIALVNVAILAHPIMAGVYGGVGLEAAVDQAAYFTVNTLFTSKSYTLFSFMFGVGFAYQIKTAERRSVDFKGRYWRRIAGLFVLGLLHVALLFQGDILVIYTILGSFLFLFRDMPADRLIRWGIGLYIAQVVIMALVAGMFYLGATLAPDAMAPQAELFAEIATLERAAFGEGSFADAVAMRFADWGQILQGGLMMQGLGALSFFVFGLAAVRLDTIANPAAPFWRTCRRIYLPIGLIGSAGGAYVIMGAHTLLDPATFIGATIIALFSPFSTAGYLGLLAKWAERPAGALKIFMARGGTSSLTAYLMQGLLLSLIFNAYGLGLFGQYGAATCIAIALGVALFTIAFASLWRTRFNRGPMEVLLRRWTYLGRA